MYFLYCIVELERVLEDIELVCDAYVEQQELFHRQKAALETGRLTEDLLPLSILNKILIKGKAQDRDHTPLDYAEWYYQHVRVTPLWDDKISVAYQAKLPFVKPVQYLRYFINSWPVPLTNTSTVRLDVEGVYGYNTLTGDLFYPHNCIGITPMVCSSGALFRGNALRCPRGIISGTDHRSDCVLLVERTTNDTKIIQVDPNYYVITTWGESYQRRCEGAPEKNVVLKMGVHMLNVSASCSLNGGDWRLAGTSRVEVHG